MNSNIFDSSFFGYSNLPDSIELDDRKLIPIKCLKLNYEANSMSTSCGLFSVSKIKTICSFVGIELHRPVKGLYCIEESHTKFFDYLYQLRENNQLANFIRMRDIVELYHNYAI
jgi:hypothetical protein